MIHETLINSRLESILKLKLYLDTILRQCKDSQFRHIQTQFLDTRQCIEAQLRHRHQTQFLDSVQKQSLDKARHNSQAVYRCITQTQTFDAILRLCIKHSLDISRHNSQTLDSAQKQSSDIDIRCNSQTAYRSRAQTKLDTILRQQKHCLDKTLYTLLRRYI